MITTAQWWEIHHFIADRLADAGPNAMSDPFAAAANAQLIVHGEVLPYRDRPDLEDRDTGFVDGLGLAVLHLAARWRDHRAYQSAWEPPRVEGRHLLVGVYPPLP